MEQTEQTLEALTVLLLASQDFINGWSHFVSRINFDQSAFDAEAIRFMNEIPGSLVSAASMGYAAKNRLEADLKNLDKET